MKKTLAILAVLAASTAASQAAATIRITELSYKGLFGEYVEITNVGDADQSMTGWHFSDNHRDATGSHSVSLAGIGTLAAGQSAIITEVSSTIFIQAWYTEPSKTALPSARIVANNTVNLGRSDEVNIYDNTNAQVDRLTFNDQAPTTDDAFGPNTEDISAKPSSAAVLHTNVFSDWVLSGDVAGGTPNGNAWKAGVPGATGPIGSPGVYPN